MKSTRDSRQHWRTVATLACVVVGLSAWWGFRAAEMRATANPKAPDEPIQAREREPDRVIVNFFGRVKNVQPQFFALCDQPAVGVVLTFSDGRTVAFACWPSQFGSVASCVGAEARLLVGERGEKTNWLLSANSE